MATAATTTPLSTVSSVKSNKHKFHHLTPFFYNMVFLHPIVSYLFDHSQIEALSNWVQILPQRSIQKWWRYWTSSLPTALTTTKCSLTNIDLVNSFDTKDDDSEDKGKEDKGKDGGAPARNFPLSIKILSTYLSVDDQQMATVGCLEQYALRVATYSFFDLESKEEMYFVVLQNQINLTLRASMATYILWTEGELVEDWQCDFVES